ncbi:MAG: EAL domain-containing protein [Methylobacter sp.]
MIFSVPGNPVILIVDDEPLNIEVLAALLSQDYRIKVATYGKMALDIAIREPQPDLILLDIMMPGMNGFDVCRALKANPKTKDIPVIFVTAAGAESESAGFDLGAVDYITKPINRLVTKLRVKAHIELAQSRKSISENLSFLSNMIENAPLSVSVLSANHQWLLLNKVALALKECQNLEQANQQNPFLFIDEAERDNFISICQSVFAGNSQELQIHFIGMQGTRRCLEIRLSPIYDAHGKIIALLSLGVDITESQKVQTRLRLLAKVFESSQEGIVIADLNGDIIDINPAFKRITGYSRAEVLGSQLALQHFGVQNEGLHDSMWQAVNEAGQWQGEIINRKKNGDLFSEWLSVTLIKDQDGKPEHYLGVFSGITLIKKHEKDLKKMAHYDVLTGLPNRLSLDEEMQQVIAMSDQERNSIAICYFDLDGFKSVNDNFGVKTGDAVLIEWAKRISHGIRRTDTVFRVGGDEFVILFCGIDTKSECTALLEKLLESVSHKMAVDKVTRQVTASVGVTLYPNDNDNPDMLLRHAYQAMCTAKIAGKNSYHFFDVDEDQRMRHLNSEQRRIRQALTRGEFELFYQPKINFHDHSVMGAEALIRWRHPERGVLSPAEFLPHIYQTDLEINVGEWVIATALAQQSQWYQQGVNIELSINISGSHLLTPDFAAHLQKELAQYPDLPTGTLQIEILETAALEDFSAAIKSMQSCQQLGVNFALDDFGTGYSSLTYLWKLPASTLKIDQGFVFNMLTDDASHAIVVAVMALAKSFSRKVVAEGVETAEQYAALAEMGCHAAQGYLIAKPMPANDFYAWYQAKAIVYNTRL